MALGFPSTAVLLYRDLLERGSAGTASENSGAGGGHPDGTTAASEGGGSPDAAALAGGNDAVGARLRLALGSALMDDGRFAEAWAVLGEIPVALRGAEWQLRAGLVAAAQRDFEEARRVVAHLPESALPEADRAWLLFLQGVLADVRGAAGAARDFFERAEAAASSPQAQARFALARARALLRVGEVTEAAAAEARRNMERLRGRAAGVHFVRTYAAMLDALGRKAEAVSLLQQQSLSLPAALRGERDDLQLLLGLIGGAGSGPGRVALRNLVANGLDPLKQRAALQLLAQASASEGAGGMGGSGQFQRDLDQLIERVPEHPVLDDLLLVRAQLALTAKDYARAERDARALLEKFPGSQRKAEAYGVLVGCAWEQLRYRAAADFAAKARDELSGESAAASRRDLGVLVAEAWFRARDYPNAADAYAAVLRELPPSAAAGALMFQRVLAEVEAGRLERAAEVLDELGADPRFDVLNRWQAEWNLARALQRAGRMREAYARVSQLVGGPGEGRGEGGEVGPANVGEAAAPTVAALEPRNPPAGLRALPAELQARMLWLQARLSLQAGEPEQTLQLVEALLGAIPEGVGEGLARELRSSCALLKAETLFSLGRRADAVELLQQVRTEFSRSNAAVYSLIVEAGYYAGQGQTVEAQQLYTKLADDFPDNAVYAPYARYQAALQAERRGQDANLEEANKLIEQMVTRYPNSPLVFYARLKQGDLLRKLNQFPQAQQVYESLVNNYPTHADVLLAQLALAECHNAQSMSDPAHADRALVLFEQLRDRVDAPVDVRVEAGLNLGYLLLRGGQAEQAEAVWWRDVVNAFLLDEPAAARLGPRGRYWMTRTLLELGGLYERQARIDQAREAWELILKTGLPGAALAEDRLARGGGATLSSGASGSGSSG
ncbi:tetratricopeptide repeat protein [Cephaloticoccus primus]|nr:tetratricopeptide repeat protein [Cephaloticoccus primus]